MSKNIKILGIISLLLLTSLVFAPRPSMAFPTYPFLPTPVPPEPYPFSDRYPAVVYLDSPTDIETLYQLEIDFEGLRTVDGKPSKVGVSFNPSLATVYVNPDEAAQLAKAGLNAIPIPNEGLRSFYEYGPGSDALNAWPTFDEFVARMQDLDINYPDLVDMISIGASVQGRDIWCLRISDNVSIEEDEPEFKYSSSMHGDETTGIEMILRLAELLLDNYNIEPGLTELVNEMETWLCPIHNPDGYVSGSRYNAYGYDLNRNFPDRFTGPSQNLQIENQAFITLGEQQNFVMGANYHGGALVVNYPWDAISYPKESTFSNYAPDDTLFHDLGLGYTSRNLMIYNGGFPEGLTRGWEWYEIWGGMQDFAYVWNGEHHVTIEVSSIKRPNYADMDTYWYWNEEAMLWWMGNSLTGVRGRVLDACNSSPISATVTVDGMEEPNFARTDPGVGDYHRVIDDGDYTLTASATGYHSLSHQVTVVDNAATTQDFLLYPTTISGNVSQAGTGMPLEATLEFLPTSLSTTSDPETGDYSIAICPGEYIIRVSAPYHFTQERLVVVDQDMVENFILEPSGQPPDLTGSEKLVSSHEALPGEIMQYQIIVQNSGGPTTATLTDTLPLSLTWTGELTATQGTPEYVDGQILWQDTLTQGATVTINYTASPHYCLTAGLHLTNLAQVRDQHGVIIERTAEISITNQVPSIPELLTPADGATDQPLDTSLSWSTSNDINCDELTYDIYFSTDNPPLLFTSGLTETNFVPGELLAHTTYYWSVLVSDGISQSQSTIWQYTTLNNPPESPITLYPPNGSVDIPTQMVLHWSSNDLDDDMLTYTLVFWSEGSQPITTTNLTDTQFNPGLLSPGVSYYWQIIVSDGFDTTIGDIWGFTTNFTTHPLITYLPFARKTSSQEP